MTWYHQRFTYALILVAVRGRHFHKYRELFLIPNRRNHMSVSVTVGHKVDFKLAFLDQHGNPMLTTPTPDSPPIWLNTTSAVGTLTAAADGLSAEETAVGAGNDTVSVNLTVGGIKFEASIDVQVQAEPQVLTSVQILATVV